MLSNRMNRNFSSFDEDSVNPTDGLANLSDAMLVLAVGIMLALVINWKIDIGTGNGNGDGSGGGGNAGVALDEEKAEELKYDIKRGLDEEADENSTYQKAGTLYIDVATGKIYGVMDEDEEVSVENAGDLNPSGNNNSTNISENGGSN